MRTVHCKIGTVMLEFDLYAGTDERMIVNDRGRLYTHALGQPNFGGHNRPCCIDGIRKCYDIQDAWDDTVIVLECCAHVPQTCPLLKATTSYRDSTGLV